MKQETKRWLLTAAALILIGVLIFVGVMARNHWDFSALGNTRFETNTYNITQEFKNISIRTGTAGITVAPSADGKCSVVFYEKEKERHTASVQDGTLTIDVTDTRSWIDHLNFFSFGSPTITLYLPQGGYDSLFIEERTGDITIPEGFTFGSVDISASTGDVEYSASASGEVQISLSTGAIHIDNINAGELDLTTSTGRVEVSSVTCGGDVAVTVSTGKTMLSDISCESVISSGSTGMVVLTNVIAEESITIARSTGDVKLEKCDAGELFIKTDTGDVTGTLLSEKVFLAQSDTGRVDVPGTVTGGRCEITTDTGDIRIEIS